MVPTRFAGQIVDFAAFLAKKAANLQEQQAARSLLRFAHKISKIADQAIFYPANSESMPIYRGFHGFFN
jgi:hypothetical protein